MLQKQTQADIWPQNYTLFRPAIIVHFNGSVNNVIGFIGTFGEAFKILAPSHACEEVCSEKKGYLQLVGVCFTFSFCFWGALLCQMTQVTRVVLQGELLTSLTSSQI